MNLIPKYKIIIVCIKQNKAICINPNKSLEEKSFFLLSSVGRVFHIFPLFSISMHLLASTDIIMEINIVFKKGIELKIICHSCPFGKSPYEM